MVERIQDLNFPIANITKIIVDSLPADVTMDKEACNAISCATSVFIMFLSSKAATVAQKHKRKMFNGQEVVDATNEMNFTSFIAPLTAYLNQHQKAMEKEKDNKKIKKAARKFLDNQRSVATEPSSSTTTIAGPTEFTNATHATNTSPPKSSVISEISQNDWLKNEEWTVFVYSSLDILALTSIFHILDSKIS